MPRGGRKKTGEYIACRICGTLVYRQRSHINRGINVTCGKRECISESMKGENNPFWGKNHDAETRERIKDGRRAHPPKGTGPKKGYQHTPEARAKITAALKERWRTNRDKMLLNNPPKNKPREEQRYRFCFTPHQRKTWTGSKCAWCDSVDELVLDHIIPVMCGGLNERKNAQTLCGPCNRWKMKYVDRPLFLAGFDNPRGSEASKPGVPLERLQDDVTADLFMNGLSTSP
jgi:5-methylcytosine-specific restriction endonuclease McrA